jgi:hypothetical protein
VGCSLSGSLGRGRHELRHPLRRNLQDSSDVANSQPLAAKPCSNIPVLRRGMLLQRNDLSVYLPGRLDLLANVSRELRDYVDVDFSCTQQFGCRFTMDST